MQITFLGSGTGFPRKERASPGILVKLNTKPRRINILMDSGPGAMRQLAKLGMTTNDIDVILYSHLHPDHTSDLIDFLFCAKYQVVAKKDLPGVLNRFIAAGGKGFRKKPLQIFGPVGFKKFLDKINGLYGTWVEASSYPLIVKEVLDSTVKLKGWTLKAAEMVHEKYSVGYRVECGGKSVVYSGDTDYCHNIVKLAKNADLLIAECSTSDEIKMPFHLAPAKIALITKESGVKKVLLAHIYEVADKFDLLKQVKQAHPGIAAGRVKLARDFMKVKI
jgi:ribonuclease BN (tRNA processing enzyme)